MSTYLDTSALLGYYLPEPRSEAFDALISAVESPAVSNLVECELVAVMGQKVRSGSYNHRDAKRAWERFRGDIQRGAFRYIVIDHQLIHAAMTLVEDLNVALRTPDLLHVAAIVHYRCGLITGDACLAEAAEQLGITTCHVPSPITNQGVGAIDAVIKTLRLDGVLDHRKWSNPYSRERRELLLIRAARAERNQLWCHVPSGAVVQVSLAEGQYRGKLLK